MSASGATSQARRVTSEDAIAEGIQLYNAGERIDMAPLAVRLGVGRATLYRWFGDRDGLLGEITWATLEPCLACAQPDRRAPGLDGLVASIEQIMTGVLESPGLGALLDREAETALRVLTSKRGVVQGRLIDATEEILRAEPTLRRKHGGPELRTLAYAVVRIAESFCYADLIADQEPDVRSAAQIIRKILS